MTFDIFQLLSSRAQLLQVITSGTLLASRRKNARAITLYHLADETHYFFAELGYNSVTQATEVLRSFVSSVPLEDYVEGCGYRNELATRAAAVGGVGGELANLLH